MSEFVKIVVTVPVDGADRLRQALGQAGAGSIGNYSFCSYSIVGTGRFKPEDGANPSIGQVGQLEAVSEERIEVTCERDNAQTVVDAMRAAHPYEEPAIDVYPLLNLS